LISPDILWSMVSAYVTLYFIAVGHSLFEKSGLLNLSIDGVFFMSTGIAVYAAYATGSPLAGSFASTLAAATVGALLACLMTSLPVFHAAVGLSMMFVGYGLGIMAGYPAKLAAGGILAFSYPATSGVNLALFAATIVVGALVHYLLKETRLGLLIVACGENPGVAVAMGVDVLKTRLVAAILGFALLGFGSSLFPLLWQRYWDIRSYTLGFGWLAFTVALVAGRHPLVLIPLSMVFGSLYHGCILLTTTLGIPIDLAKALPFIAAIVAVVVYGKTRIGRALLPPASLGKVFYREERAV